jgi:hypothetical protein
MEHNQQLAIAETESDIYSFMSKNILFNIEKLAKLSCGSTIARGLKLLADAIRRTRSVEKITFEWGFFNTKYSREIFNALAINTSVKALLFHAIDTLDETKIHVKSLMTMVAYNKTLEMIQFSWSKPSHEILSHLCEGLKQNTAVTCLKFDEAGLDDDSLQLLAEVLLVNGSLTELSLDMSKVEEGVATLARGLHGNNTIRHVALTHLRTNDFLEHIVEIAKMPNISVLELIYCSDPGSEPWISFFESLQSNSSLTTLRIDLSPISIDSCRALGHLLEVNTTLTELGLTRCKLDDDDCEDIMQALKVNTTLTNLSLSGNLINSDEISKVLQVNSTLKSLNLNFCEDLDPQLEDLSDALMVNTSLTDLEMLVTIRVEGMLNLGQALEYNGSLRKLHVELPLRFDKQRTYFSEFLGSLKRNKSLTELNFRTDKPPQKTDGKLIAYALRNNKAITSLTVFGMESNSDINRWLKRNKKIQRDYQNTTFNCIKLIALRPVGFLEIFPLEIWKLIFEKITFPGLICHFGELFDDVMKNPQRYFRVPMEIDKIS